MSELRPFRLPYTEDPAKLVPSAFVEQPIKEGSQYKSGKLMQLADVVEELIKTGKKRDVTVLRDGQEVILTTDLKLVQNGQESLVFVVEQETQPGEAPKQRNFVVKVNYSYSLLVLEQSLKSNVDQQARQELIRSQLAEEALRQTEKWNELRHWMPEANIPTSRFFLEEVPVNSELIGLLYEAQTVSPKILPGQPLPETVQVLAMQQRQDRFPADMAHRMDIGCVPFWSILKKPERLSPDQWRPEKEELQEQIQTLHEAFSLPGSPDPERLVEVIDRVFPEYVEFVEEREDVPEELAEVTQAMQQLDVYLQATRTALDITGANNISLVRRSLPTDAYTPWKLLFLDPFTPKASPEEAIFNLDDLAWVLSFANGYTGQSMTDQEWDIVHKSVHIYYQVMAVKAWCCLLHIPSSLTIPGWDTVNLTRLRALYQKVTGLDCL